ncbi:MAG TPA: Gfo/Idh/MocA family oxidoreductase [Bacteroidales bacterium]|nr:Gfo/Idh/MocA family oxidoreductase [Bacteroidales bacterium]HOK75794.1 Gfo/Idh/MocA family oxidoreductase [Bacteroidales bacterium]HOU31444.1 Gfo/Idh/MocA family oxidoreductase [Bacteroidales bacterium]HPP92724.1 Gfo/Idh/MocA family oxidoreductase [Bacteroidales bacterium]HQG56372.1 Gfo/Idh/MocA family oxidoreductase [Bacteroidales bacterium]
MKETNKISRRSFIGTTGAVAAGFTILPSSVISGLGHRPPSDKLNIACVGIGGMGNSNLRNVAPTENIVALCDVDWEYSKKVFETYPNAKRYWDWRKMFDEMGKSIDAVIVATADHTHAIIAAHAITLGKHVYVQKPLTHTVYESRLLTKLAAKYKVATQMGNQGASDEGVNLIIEWIQNGEIGEVTKVEAFTDRPIWPQGLNKPAKGEWVPDTLNWDLFIGPAPMRPYHSIYHPWNWRGWWDFGTGALGDMACHILHPVFKALKLKYPTKVQASSTLLLSDCAPNAEMVRLIYPERPAPKGSKIKYPQVEVTWYDGGLQPMKPAGWPAGKNMNDGGGGVIFHGTKDKLICGCYGRNPWLLSGRVPNVPKTERRIEKATSGGHEMDWVRACKESPESRVPTKSDFAEAGPFNEMVVMGVLAVRLQGLNKELEWDGEKMEFTNISDNDTLRICLEDNFTVTDGHPTFNRKYTEPMSAKQFAAEMIKHTYRKGWSLPDMPA